MRYLSDDSLALLDVAPAVKELSVLDMCCGGGVQGLSALRRGARDVTFVDVNPRAIHFVHFNLAINGLDTERCRLHLGNTFDALPAAEEKFDLILSNPPFLPNPDNIASQAVAAYGNGGASGEEVLETIVAGCPNWLKPGGRLWLVTYAPNIEEMPQRLQRYLGSQPADVTVAGGALKDARDFVPAASQVELICYQWALSKQGIRNLAHALALLELRDAGSESSARSRYHKDHHAMSSLVHLSPDLQDRVLTYIDNTKVYFMNARSKSGYFVSACDKARRGALDEKGIGAVDPWKDHLLSIARPQVRPIDLVPEAEWLERFPDALEFIIGVPADEKVQVSYIRLSLLLSHTIASVKKKLADIGIRIPIPKMRLREARVGFMADERTGNRLDGLRTPQTAVELAGTNDYELLCMRLSASRWKPIESLDSTCIHTWGDLRASLEELVGYRGGSSRLGVVHLFILYRDEEPVLIKVGKVAWSLLFSDTSIPLSALSIMLNDYRLSFSGFDAAHYR
ncbi:unnamed protein product [Symbiodinium sp. CCMP2592]|nr:unnamed protein product [Symbiodinium sp. CCMP2592]